MWVININRLVGPPYYHMSSDCIIDFLSVAPARKIQFPLDYENDDRSRVKLNPVFILKNRYCVTKADNAAAKYAELVAHSVLICQRLQR